MDSPHHLSERDVAGYLDRSLSVEDRHRVDVHIEACPDCRTELIAVMRLAPTGQGRARLKPWIWVPAAAAAGLAFLLLLRPMTPDTPQLAERPISAPADAMPRLAVTTPANGDSVLAAGMLFQWRSRTGDSYRVTVLTETGEPVWTAETTDTSITLPHTITLEPGRLYFWRVDAVADGLSATSGIQRFLVVR